ncbi:MAG: glutathione S-transferase family protein, partial [Rhodospirillaceae bacterium]|nr:glutathione S-transferase family protein [Rhodospirillaceae bacterium]
GGFKAEPGRYHLYASPACPFAHRALIMRKLKGLEDVISVSFVDPVKLGEGWVLAQGADPINGKMLLRGIYTLAEPDYTGRVSVPVLWDKQQATIVGNGSAEIIRMFNRAFDAWGRAERDYCPDALVEEIDAMNAFVAERINEGVYAAGFAGNQQAHSEAVIRLFDALDVIEERLTKSAFLVGDTLTEADIRLFTTLARFDGVYHGHFKCNLRRLIDYAALWAYARCLYAIEEFAETCDFEHMKHHYYASHLDLNPTGIVPEGPDVDWGLVA